MIHCHCEPLERLLPELPPLLQAHWDESEAALFGPQVYALDTKRYLFKKRRLRSPLFGFFGNRSLPLAPKVKIIPLCYRIVTPFFRKE